MTIRYLIQKEFLQIRRNSFMPKIIFIFPIVIMCVMPWVMNQEVKNIVVDVVDNDRSMYSQRLVHRIEASPYFIFGGQQPTYAAALKEIEQSRADIVLVIPQDYSRDLVRGRHPQVLIAANAVNGTKGSIGSSYLSQIVSASLSPRSDDSRGVSQGAGVLNLYNKSQSYKVFMIPALMGILMMMLCGFLPALNIVGEKETGTIEQINVTPVSKWAFILAKPHPLLDHRDAGADGMSCALMGSLWHHLPGTVGTRLSLGDIAGIVLLLVRTDHLQLQRHHAAGNAGDVVLCGLSDAAQWFVHANTFHAVMGVCHHLYQSDALFH